MSKVNEIIVLLQNNDFQISRFAHDEYVYDLRWLL